jgi:general secretion pathway protein K
MKESRRGIALLIVLWVLTILTVIVFSFSVLTRAESYGTFAFKEGMEKKYLAEAGIERGIMELIYRSVTRKQTVTLEGKEVWKPDGTAYTVDMGQGGCVVRVIDESGKISLNGLNDASGIILKNLLIRQGTSPENADIIVDSILDWKDTDDLHRLNGAENDYYKTLPKPYKAANKDFETLEELILVRGMTSEILYGTAKTNGIIPFLTAYGKTNRININAAPKEVLAALPGMDAAALDRIMEFRASSEITAEGVVRELLGAAYPLMATYVSFASNAQQRVFSVEATGYKETPKKGYSILATVAFDGPHQYRYVYYKSPVEILQ